MKALTVVGLVLVPATGVAQVAARVAGAPGTYQVVAVAVPAALPAAGAVAFEVVPSGTVSVLGALRGTLAPGRGDRVVVFSIGIPAHARAGRDTVARVRFSSETGSPADVPVELVVSRVRRASLALAHAVFGTKLGERVTLRYRLTNTGNAADSFVVRATGPVRWSTVPDERFVVPAGGSVEDAVTITVPRSASTGTAVVEFAASDAGGELVRAQATLEVVDDVPTRGDQVWRVTPGVAAVFGDTAAPSPVLGLDLEGPVTNGVRLYGHLVQSAGLDAAHLWGLARVGYFPGTNYLSLTGGRWRLTGGHTSQTFSDVTGVNFWGSGAAFNYGGGDARWSAATLAAAPITVGAGTGGNGHLLGAQLGVELGGGWVRATATDALEPTPAGRRLQAVGLGATSPSLLGTLFSGEVAQRWFATGQGLGWLAEVKRQGEGDNLLIRFTHAPGGSAAFAPARDMLTAYGSRRIVPAVVLTGGVWNARDTSSVFSRLTSSGWSVAPQLAVGSRVTVELEARSNRFDATDSLGTFGNSETDGRLGVTARFGKLLGTGSATVGRATRTTAFTGGSSIAATADVVGLGGSLQWISAAGVVQATADYQQSGAGVGFLPRQYTVGLRADGVPFPSHPDVLLNAGVQHYDWFGARPSATTVRFGLRAPFPGAVVVRLDAEHNPLFLSSAGGSGWNIALKLEHPMAIRARPATMTGVVYEDLNGNGRRDSGEPAVQGALVRRDGEAVITDAHGLFRFFRQTDVPAELDESSLPFGLVTNPATRPERGAKRAEIAVTPTAPVAVHLDVTVPSGQPRPAVDLRSAVVRARDAAGNLWTALPDSAGTATFHALPPGQYHLELDLTGLKEPLLLRGDLPVFQVEAGREVPRITITLAPRPIRFSQPGGGMKLGIQGNP